MAMFPVDTVKTQMQALTTCPIKSIAISSAIKSIIKSDGVFGFYRGIGAMALGAGPAHAVYFTMYEVCKKGLLSERKNSNNNNKFELFDSGVHAISGVLATIVSDAVFTPMDMVKQRLQLGKSPYKGVRDCVKRVLKEEGVRAFYASYKYCVDECRCCCAFFRLLRLVVHATAGAAAGALAAIVTTPLDVVKTQLQCQGVCGCDRFTSSSIGDVFKTIVKKDGYRGLLRGWAPRMLFHAPAASICWSTYEAGKEFFQELNSRNVT
ncbi:hypothetical protein Leryth_026146 [Lithospermum erythrorhizon]|nr:hypothetical protein Leryth_026146 [Lithospermum erythrorhizon]